MLDVSVVSTAILLIVVFLVVSVVSAVVSVKGIPGGADFVAHGTGEGTDAAVLRFPMTSVFMKRKLD